MKFAILFSLLLWLQLPAVRAQKNNNVLKSKQAATAATEQKKAKAPTPEDYQSYLSSLSQKIRTVWSPLKNGAAGVTNVSFKINKDGSVSDVKTGSKTPGAQEKLVIAAIKKAAPFKAPPLDPKVPSLDVKIDLDYRTFSGNLGQ